MMYALTRSRTRRPVRRKPTTKRARPARKGGIHLGSGVPFFGGSSITWKKPTRRPRASRSVARAKMYKSASSLMSRNMRYGQSFNTGAVSMGMDDGVVHVKHREFLGVINSSTAFTTQQYDLNPGLSRLCPWGSSIANNFQQYKINAMAFEFISTSATALSTGSNNALGQISIATQYDSLQPEFRNLNDMLNSQWATSTKISSDLLHPIEAEKAQTTATPLYTRSGRAPGDIRLYDWGKTTLAVYGCQSTGDQIGQIWVSYDICFYKPITYNLDGGNAESAFITCQREVGGVGVIDFGNGTPLGGRNYVNFDNIGITLQQQVGALPLPLLQSLTLPAGSSGYYQLVFAYWANEPRFGQVGAGTFTVSNGAVQNQFWNLGTAPVAGNPGVPNSVDASAFVYIISIPDPSLPCVLTFNADWNLFPFSGDRGAVLNITVSQLNVGYDLFQETPKSGDICCDSLQSQIDALTLLVEKLQTEEAESEAESEHSDEEEQKDEQRQDDELLALRALVQSQQSQMAQLAQFLKQPATPWTATADPAEAQAVSL